MTRPEHLLMLAAALGGCGRSSPYRTNGPQIRVDPPSVDFGAVDAGSTIHRQVVVSNVGTSTLHFVASLDLTSDPAFSLANIVVEKDLAAAGADGGTSSAGLDVSFQPVTSTTAYAGAIDVVSNDPYDPQVVVPLKGECACAHVDMGCADGTREGFVDPSSYPNIAGCSGGFALPGVGVTARLGPACNRQAGNDSSNPNGNGCNLSDLCQEGWHVCDGASEIQQKSSTGCGGVPSTPQLFFVSRQSGPGCSQCATGNSTDPAQCNGGSCQAGCAQTALMANDVFGCGNVGDAPYSETCGPLNRFGNNLCGALPSPWTCGADGTHEADNLTKAGPSVGGVLCCRD